MKTLSIKIIAVLFFVFISITTTFSAQELHNVEVTYIANEGFLIKINNKTILIDAIFGDQEYGFCDIPDTSTLNQIRLGEGIFSNIDIIAATHCHIDHFYPSFVVDHLANNERGTFISTAQSIDQIKNTDSYNQGISSKLISITPDTLTYQDTVISGIGIRVYRLIHGPYYINDPKTGERVNRHKDIQNLGFLFNIDGVKVFHCGDSSPTCITDYQNFQLDKEDIDIAFLGPGFMWKADCDGINVIKDYIKPKHIVLMHIAQDQNRKYIDIANSVANTFPSIKIFENKLETKTYSF